MKYKNKVIFTTDNERHYATGDNGQVYPRFRPASDTLKFMLLPETQYINLTVESLNKIREQNSPYIDDTFMIYEIHTEQNPQWWSGLNKPLGPNMIEIIPSWVLDKVRNNTAFIYYDQLLEGFPLNGYLGDFYTSLYKLLKDFNLPAHNIIFATCNLIEQQVFDDWCKQNNISDRLNIVNINMFAAACSHSGFFGPGANEITVEEHLAHKTNNNTKLFNSLNRVIREHRVAMTSMLNYYDLVEGNLVSQDIFPFHQSRDFNSVNFKNHDAFNEHNILDINSKLPLVLDTNQFEINKAQNFFTQVYLDSWVSLITETYFSEPIDQTVFFSEKIYKPIRARHPFILAGQYKALHEFRKLGFKTFSEFWDEDYDSIQDNTDRMQAICALLNRLSTLSVEQWIEMYKQMTPILNHNMKVLTKTNWRGSAQEFLQSIIPDNYKYYEL